MLIKGSAVFQDLKTYIEVFIKSSITVIYAILLVNCNAAYSYYSTEQVEILINQNIPQNELRVSASSDVVAVLNHILHHFSSREDIHNAMKRMNRVKPLIENALQNKNLPLDLMVLPIVESEYKQSQHERGMLHPAGIWQMVPETARKYGLIINGKRDDRLDIQAQTVAITQYLNDLYSEFRDWRLVLIAYKLGDARTMHLIKKVGSHDPRVLVHSKYAPANLKHYLSKIDSIIIIMHNPSLIGFK